MRQGRQDAFPGSVRHRRRKKIGPAHGRRRDEFCAINTGAQWLTVSRISATSSTDRAVVDPVSRRLVRNDPVLTTRGWLLRHYDPVSPGAARGHAAASEHQGVSLMGRWAWARGGDCESTSPRSPDELAQLRTHTAHYSPVMIAPLSINSSHADCRPERLFFFGR